MVDTMDRLQQLQSKRNADERFLSHRETHELLGLQEREVERLRSFFAETLPFLKEAWESCFDGAKEKLLSAEERGMGRLLAQFQEIADGKPQVPFGLVTVNECSERVENAIEWAHRTLGQPNSLREPLRQWMRCGETCADGLERANAEVERLRAIIDNGLGPEDLDGQPNINHPD